uniref:Uncharacterized protein n=1 Tax=Rhizophora mucronata TaxID=61149 RepID=A0A2P2NIU7_RHIMU
MMFATSFAAMDSRPWVFLSALAYPKYGITAVIFLAEALRQASIMIKSSNRFSFAGGQVGCTK